MLIGEGQSERNATTGGIALHIGRLTLWARAWLVVLFVLAVAGCASPERLPPVPSADTAKALPLGLANARFFPLVDRAAMIAEWEQCPQAPEAGAGTGAGCPAAPPHTFSPFPAAATTARSVPASWSGGPKPVIAPSFRS